MSILGSCFPVGRLKKSIIKLKKQAGTHCVFLPFFWAFSWQWLLQFYFHLC